jgi:pimeloyl-ACP methyl ester carboxylesterase
MKSDLLNVSIEGKGQPLILIHGVAGSLHIWDPIVDELSKDYRIVRMDLLGYGHSPKPHVVYTPLTHVTAIRDTLIQKGIQPPYTLIGLSMGVSLALEYAARWPEEVSGFIGIGFPYYPNEVTAKKGLHNNTWTRLTIEHTFLAQIIIPTIWGLARHGILPAESFSRIYSPLMARETMLNPYYVFKSSVWNTMVRNPQTKLLKESGSMKRLFIHGTDDVWASPADVAAAIEPYKKSELKIIQNKAHNLVVLEPKLTTKYIKQYLSEQN